MERTLSMHTFLFLSVSMLVAGCSAAPRSAPPAPATVATPLTTSQGTPAATEATATPEGGPVADAATKVSRPTEDAPLPRSSRTAAAPVASTPAASLTAAVIESTPTPSPTAKPVATAAQTASVSKDSGVVDPGGLVEVKATKSGLTRIGSDKCKLCHKVQFTSWAKTAHATRTPPLDCESCHGAGSEYKGMAIMKDSAKAHAAGLVSPDKAFCTKCHKSGWKDDLLKQAHAHKAGA